MHQRRKARTRSLGLALAIAGLGLAFAAGCASDDTEDEAAQPAQPMMVTMLDLAFEPAEIQMRSGEHVRLELRNQGSMEHDFTVEEMPVEDVHVEGASGSDEHAGHGEGYALHMALAAGGTGTLEFAPSERGRYEYYCTVEGHRDAGMTGTLVVE